MKISKFASALLALPLSLAAQTDKPLPTATYVPYSTTAMGVTGNVRTAPGQIVIGAHRLALRAGRPLSGDELKSVAASMPADLKPGASGSLYRVAIPAAMRFKGGNTFCGSAATTFLILIQSGDDLEMEAFSGSAVPDLSPSALNQSTNVCGGYGYTRK